MIYFIDAVMFALFASIWSKEGWPNIVLAVAMAALAVVNAIGAVPYVSKLVQF